MIASTKASVSDLLLQVAAKNETISTVSGCLKLNDEAGRRVLSCPCFEIESEGRGRYPKGQLLKTKLDTKHCLPRYPCIFYEPTPEAAQVYSNNDIWAM